MDSGLIDEIVCKVKSEGLFDQFRRECLADVDTKPAYQNLQHRVESSVTMFLDEQKWDPQTNKNQLREKLRKLITEKSFFEAGIGRIVDQVVNPKLNTNFVPKIEDVAYKLLGVERPSMNAKLKLEIDTDILLPIYELEQVSPESEISQSHEMKYATIYQANEEIDGKNEDLESPAFEPIEPTSGNKSNLESIDMNDDDMDISDDNDEDDDDVDDVDDNDDDEDDDDDDVDDDDDRQINGESNEEQPMETDSAENQEATRSSSDNDEENVRQINGFTSSHIDEVKSNLSSISGLTSNESNQSSCTNLKEANENSAATTDNNINLSRMIGTENRIAPEITIENAERLPISENIISNTSELIIDNLNQDSVLSQVSSTSRLSIVTNNNTNTRTIDGDCESSHEHVASFQNTSQETCPYGISEEAQMQKFNENSSSSNSLVIDTDNTSIDTFNLHKKALITTFNVIKFEGTTRRPYEMNNVKKCTENVVDDENDMRENSPRNTKTENKKDSQTFDSNESVDSKFKNLNSSILDSSSNQVEGTNRHNADQFSPVPYNSYEDINNTQQLLNMEDNYKTESGVRISSKRYTESAKDNISSISGDDDINSNPHNVSLPNTSRRKKKSNRERSTSKKDDHSTHKSKLTSRQRSRSKDSKDSNDGFTQTNIQSSSSCNESNIANKSTSHDHTTNIYPKVTEHVTSHSTTNELDQSIYKLNSKEYQQSMQEMIPNSQPVVIDQILTGNELDLTSFIGENRDDPVLSSIKQSLETKIKKPKLAANMFEAKRLIKIRKQIELSNQKKLEKATVLAKQYIRTNASNILDDTQGIELEFVCAENRKGRNMSGPIISSPITKKIIDSGHLVCSSPQTSMLTSLKNVDEMSSLSKKTKLADDNETEILDFFGFETSETQLAVLNHQNFFESVKSSTKSGAALSKISKLVDLKKYQFFENKETSVQEKSPDAYHTLVEDDEVILGNVFVSKSSREYSQTTSRSAVKKQREKTRYSNDDLFKPRPLLGGLTRRRRGYNCND